MMKSMRTARAEIKKNNSIIVVAECIYNIDGHGLFKLNATLHGIEVKSAKVKGQYKTGKTYALHFQEHAIVLGQLVGTIRKSTLLYT